MHAHTHHIQPEVGHWYNSKNVPECFMVIDTEGHEYIEIQYQDGEIDKIEFEGWDGLHLEEIPEPEDAAAPFEMEHEDIINMLNEIENEVDEENLEAHLRHIDEEDWH